MVAIAFTVLFLASLFPVVSVSGAPNFPAPWDTAQTIATFFQLRSASVALCAFLQFGAAIPLGIFTATIVSRLRFLGVRAAGANIALFGGFATAGAVALCGLVLWTVAQPGIAQNVSLTQALYIFGFGIGGPGYSVPLGILMAGVSITSLAYRLAPRWICYLGIALAVCGELSWLSLEIPRAAVLIPLTRFPGFLWMIAIGFTLPATLSRSASDQGRSHA
jgi:hypothetical protein